jgi:hypothetical protein
MATGIGCRAAKAISVAIGVFQEVSHGRNKKRPLGAMQSLRPSEQREERQRLWNNSRPSFGSVVIMLTLSTMNSFLLPSWPGMLVAGELCTSTSPEAGLTKWGN